MTVRVRTGYSFRSAVGRIEDVLGRLQEVGMKIAPITDTASTFGYVRWKKGATKLGMRPAFGVELAVTKSINDKKPSVDYWTFLAIDSLKPIHELIDTATKQFRYQPLLTVEQASSRSDVFAIAGSRADFSQIAPHGLLYCGVSPSITRGQLRRAIEAGFPLAAASDNRYPRIGGQGFYETVCGRNASTQSYPQHIQSDGEWREDMLSRGAPEAVLDAALANRDAILERSVADLVPAEMVHPPRPKSLLAMCREGAKRLGCDLRRPEYKARLEKELKLIASKGFEDYFYLVADICQWARDRMIVGPARGSSCGSLVCYLLRITSVDPIPFGLIFERFIDVNRSDLPDIDIDFPEHRRNEVFEYIAGKYGREKVARLGTVAMYQPRSALKEAAGAMNISPWLLEPVLDSIIERSSGDARALQATEDTLRDTPSGRDFLAKYPEILVATQMEGHPRHYSQHAAGIVITEHPTENYVAVDQRTGATMCDKKDAEALNLLKIDALGLTQLSIFEYALELAGLPRDHLFTIPLDDPKAFDVINKSNYAGIFQFNGLALQYITSIVTVESLDDMATITALGRPGPLNTGGTNQWIQVKSGKTAAKYPHPLFEPFLKDTLGVVAYQEQVMVIGREIGDLTWEDVTDLRKAMSKSLGKEFFDKYGDRWKAGARKKGIDEETLDRVWDDLCAYGSWAFNKSHAVAYGIVSYWCCWLKAHYPLEFAAATLSYTDKEETQIKLLRELANEGVSYLPADAELSGAMWTIKKGNGWNHLVGPLSNVLGIGPKMMAGILGARARGEPMSERAQKLLTNPKTKIDSLFPIRDAFARILPDPKAANIYSTPRRVIDVQPNGEVQEVMVFAVAEQIKPRNENEEMTVQKRIARGQRGIITDGPTDLLQMRVSDDTDVIFCRVDRWKFEKIGRPIVDRGRAGKALYAIKGTVPKDFRMINVTAVRYIGDLDPDHKE